MRTLQEPKSAPTSKSGQRLGHPQKLEIGRESRIRSNAGGGSESDWLLPGEFQIRLSGTGHNGHTGYGYSEMQTETITSRENKWLKKFRAALQGTGPAAGAPIGVEGPKLVEQALQAGLDAEAMLVTEGGEAHLERIFQAAAASDAGIPRARVLRTTEKHFAGLAGTESPQGVAGLFAQRAWRFEDLLRGFRGQDDRNRGTNSPLVVILTEIQDPGNVGTIVRSAEAFGATGVIATRGSADPWSPKALRASAGSSLRVPLLRGIAIPVLLAQLRIAQVKIYAASARGENASDPAKWDMRGPAGIFIGNEGAGLPGEVVRAADATISIPISDVVESLNAGVAASLLLYEVARCRRDSR
jgi:TrmH family RNA methyltransferase